MTRLLGRAAIAAAALFTALGPSVTAQERAVARRGVNVRPDPSTAHTPLTKLTRGDTVAVLEPDTNAGFLHVATETGDTGWSWSGYLRLLPPVPAPDGQGPAAAIAEAWDKPAPNETHFTNPDGADCGPSGDGGDAATNLRKNRTDEPADGEYHAVSWDAVATLSYPHNRHASRAAWSQGDLDQIARFEGVALTVTGFLAGVVVEDKHRSQHGESTNCHATEPDAVDWHVSLVGRSGDPKYRSIVVETTPRVRANHHWSAERLQPFVGTADSVRISGWLMLDPEHYAQTYRYDGSTSTANKYRITLWEIHPITRIAVFQNNGWVDLDSLP